MKETLIQNFLRIAKIPRPSEHEKEIASFFGEDWMINIVSLKEGKSYLFYSNQQVKNNLETLFEVSLYSFK